MRNFDFLYNPLTTQGFLQFQSKSSVHSKRTRGVTSLKNVAGFGRRTLRSSLALLSVVGAIGRAGLREEVGLLRPGPRGPKVLRHQMVR